MTPRTPPSCSHWIGALGRRCDNPKARLYLVGHRCEQHTPARLIGRPEPAGEPLSQSVDTATSTTNQT